MVLWIGKGHRAEEFGGCAVQLIIWLHYFKAIKCHPKVMLSAVINWHYYSVRDNYNRVLK